MTQVDFYILGAGHEANRLLTACKVVEKAWRQGLRVLIQAADESDARAIDTLLWTFRQESFVPHETLAVGGPPPVHTGDGPAPVLIASGGARSGGQPAHDVLVNVGESLPDLGEPAPGRIAEFVAADATGRARGRERYRQYRTLGFELKTHEL